MIQIFIVSGTSWTVPTDWNSANNIVETIGGGGGGQTANAAYAGSGGGGGAYSKITNLSLTAGSSITIQVGTGGAAGTPGGDTWFNGASLAASSVGAKAGDGGGDGSGGAGGAASGGIGTVRYDGGNGGTNNTNPYGGAGGGGAAGPNGAGSNGAGSITATYGGGGGGGNGGGPSTAGNIGGTGAQGYVGGAGGTSQSGASGGSGGAANAAGNSGSQGSGGGGGGGSNPAANGGGGGNGVEWTSLYGSGGGGGGGGGQGSGICSANGGNGGNYGAGGGGSGWGPSLGGALTGGSGAQGVIVVTYTPTVSAAVTAESWSGLEAQETARADQPVAIEYGLTVPCDSRPPNEAGGSLWRSNAVRMDFPHVAARDLGFSAEWAGAVAFTVDALARLEASARSSVDATVSLEPASRALQEVAALSEWNAIDASQTWPAVEQLATVGGDCAPKFECVGKLAGDAQPCLEWADPPGLLLVSSERLLRPPGRVRILASSGSVHPLRG